MCFDINIRIALFVLYKSSWNQFTDTKFYFSFWIDQNIWRLHVSVDISFVMDKREPAEKLNRILEC